MRAAIYAPAGAELTPREAAFFREAAPWGFILFARNYETPEAMRRLTGELREAVGRDAPVLIDQEGGRVQRLRGAPFGDWLPALDQMERAADPMRAQWLRNRLIADELLSVGIDANCAPLADLVEADTHPVLRNRLYGSDPGTVARAARVAAEAHLAGGVLPILKHLPGYGRAHVDPHLGLPRVPAPLAELEARDFAPFRALSDLPLGMTAHLVVDALDPGAPVTTSPAGIAAIRSRLGFGGLLMTDDISMEALAGTVAERARASWAAGCDLVLHCNGEMAQMEAIATQAPLMGPEATARSDAALAMRRAPVPCDRAAAMNELDTLLAA
ncbi:MAG: glycoside hydrolase family 3 N-terminal domain-containing protein [Paracoccaceae bacterium]